MSRIGVFLSKSFLMHMNNVVEKILTDASLRSAVEAREAALASATMYPWTDEA